ncbi:MAG: sulfatase-like hydrolase/transferase [Opitutaceae bacterium]
MKLFHHITTIGLFVGLAATSLWAEAPRPNIILIMADDLGYNDVGFNGSTDIRTPEMDGLASQGTIFSSAYVAHPFCGPSRMALMTGRYPHEMGTPYNLPAYNTGRCQENGVDVNEPLFSSVLQSAGYYTGVMGKWHLGHKPEFHPNNRGFDEFYGFLGGGTVYFGPYLPQESAGKAWDYKVCPQRNGVGDMSLTKEDYMTDVLSEKGVEFIHAAKAKEQPFFLFMSYNAPHTPLEAKASDEAMFPELSGDRKTYAAMVYAMDRGIGQIVEALKETGVYENTLIVFLSDNGGRSDKGASNLPLTGVKGDVLEGGFRVPMFFHWPKGLKSGVIYEHPVTALDFYPSFAQLAGAEIPANKDLDGVDILSALQNNVSARKGELIYTIRHRAGFSDVGVRRDSLKAVRLRMGQWKLYDVDKDPGETKDLSAEYPEVLSGILSKMKQDTVDHTRPVWFYTPKDEVLWDDEGTGDLDKLLDMR